MLHATRQVEGCIFLVEDCFMSAWLPATCNSYHRPCTAQGNYSSSLRYITPGLAVSSQGARSYSEASRSSPVQQLGAKAEAWVPHTGPAFPLGIILMPAVVLMPANPGASQQALSGTQWAPLPCGAFR